jgi:diaminopimelate epimerase
MKKIKYSIYSGAGNDFVMINNLGGLVAFDKQKEFTIKVCNEQFKQIDGVIFLEKPMDKNNSIRMNYYNRDGSYGAMCGNGARCIAQFSIDIGILHLNSFNLEAVDKVYKAEIEENNIVRIYFPPPNGYKLNINVEKANGLSNINVNYMDLGSEHLVLFINDELNKSILKINSLDDAKINEWGKSMRYHPQFQPSGANVNFVDVLSQNELRVRTYERGVERETLACGTGIISSALISAINGKANPPVKVLVQSREWLSVDFILKDNNKVENLSLEGSARKIDEGIIDF